jgi:hypothetical protein
MSERSGEIFRVTLLGTGAPPPSLERFGPSTLGRSRARKIYLRCRAWRDAAALPVRNPIQRNNRRFS